ncbi:hypothetical protein Hanom_Chr06g00548611 [Helianthus anomalus]
MRIIDPVLFICVVSNFSSLAEQPGTDQRLPTFRAFDSTVRIFKPKAKDLAEASSTSLTMQVLTSLLPSSILVTLLAGYPRSLKKKLARGPSQPELKTMSTHAKTCSKRKKPADSAEAEEKLTDLRSTTAAKEKRIVQLEKEVNGLKKKIMVVEIEANKVELEAAEEAKICVGTSGAKEQKEAAGDEACGDVVAGGNATTIGNEGC